MRFRAMESARLKTASPLAAPCGGEKRTPSRSARPRKAVLHRSPASSASFCSSAAIGCRVECNNCAACLSCLADSTRLTSSDLVSLAYCFLRFSQATRDDMSSTLLSGFLPINSSIKSSLVTSFALRCPSVRATFWSSDWTLATGVDSGLVLSVAFGINSG